MYKKEIKVRGFKHPVDSYEFDNLTDVIQWIKETEYSKPFRENHYHKVEANMHHTNDEWGGNVTWNESVDLLLHGWKDGAEKITQKIKSTAKADEGIKHQKTFLSMQGYQAHVPNYVMGQPLSMINKKSVVIKQKVVTINRIMSYNGSFSANEIMEYGLRALQIIRKIESQGIRVKLNLLKGTKYDGYVTAEKICIKRPDERINISKLAFPIAHTGMYRKLMFNIIQKQPTWEKVDNYFAASMGVPLNDDELRRIYNEPDQYFIPSKLYEGDVRNINSLDDLQKNFQIF